MSYGDNPVATRRLFRLTVLAFVILLAAIVLSHVFSPIRMLSEWPWGYMHLVPTATKVRLINETRSEVTIGWPGGCNLVPWTDEIVRFVAVDPPSFEAVDSDGEQLPFRRIDDRTFQYESDDYPIVVTFTVVEIRDGEVRLAVSAEVLDSDGQ